MAKILVVHDSDPAVFIELVVDEIANWDGTCTYPECGFTISDGGTRFTSAEDALNDAEMHIDKH